MSSAPPWWIDFVAGWCSGATSLLISQPLDTILTRQQAIMTHSKIHQPTLVGVSQSMSPVMNPPHPPLVSSSIIPTGSSSYSSWIPKSTHFTSLWRGVSPMIGAVPIQNALLMSGYGLGKSWSTDSGISNDNNRLLYWGVFIGGCTGGILQSFLMSPIELLKVTQQVYRQNVSSALMTLHHHSNNTATTTSGTNTWRNIFLIWKLPLWKGLHATLWRDGIPHGVWFASYEFLKNTLDEAYLSDPKDDYTYLYHSMISGAFAATCAWLVGYPFDIIKTRIQANVKMGSQGVFETARILIQESGGRPIQALYRGLGLKLLRAIPASAIGFCVYEWVKSRISS